MEIQCNYQVHCKSIYTFVQLASYTPPPNMQSLDHLVFKFDFYLIEQFQAFSFFCHLMKFLQIAMPAILEGGLGCHT